ncbi:MAG TPA: hypothetical protein VKA21_02470 [Candidatus Binatia bacterium]|nr:hypothetical protein [Candidatus Binatia bacterium]
MADPLDRPLRFVFRALAVAFAVTGLLFFLFPDGTVRTLNAVGRPLGFPDAPASALRFWLSLAVAYMVLVTLLAAATARDPRGRVHLMPILAAGKATSSLTCLGYFVGSSPAFIYLLNALVDGSLALLVIGAWAAVRLTDEAGAARDGALLRAVLDALVPRGGAFPTGAADVALDAALARYFARLHPLGPAGLRALLLAIEYGAVAFERTRPFSRLDPEARGKALAAWETSRLAPRRQLLASLKLLALMHFYERPEVWPSVGYDDAYLRRKLLAGPNAVHHAARLEVAS